MKEIATYCLLFFPGLIFAQSIRDSILAKERSIDRPITLHKGQLRIEGGYALSAVTKRFDGNQNIIRLRNEGISFVRHVFFTDVKYGILENLHISFATQYNSQTQRNEQVIVQTINGVYSFSEIYKKQGIEDMLISIAGRAPFFPKSIDLIVFAGIGLPMGSDQDQIPKHSVDFESGYPSYTYRFYPSWGKGSLFINAGGAFKYRGKNSAVSIYSIYDYPLKESTNLIWQHQLINNRFHYQSQSYSYMPSGILKSWLELERQLAPWFDLSLIIHTVLSNGGWQEVAGIKVTNAAMQLVQICPGYEILVTPKIWLRQRACFSLAGQSSEGPFTISTSLVYNFFPF